MSNVRGIGDFENDRRGSGRGGGDIPLLGSAMMNSDNPRKEPFFIFLKNFFCPLSTMKSVIFFISVVDVVMYIVTLCFGIGKATPENNQLLPPLTTTLDTFGMLNPVKLRKWELWRWITYAFLHADFVHIFYNLLSQIIIGSFVERVIGPMKLSLLYFTTGVLGALFAVLIDQSNSVGASIAIYGLLGAYIGFSFLNWNYLDTVYGPVNKYLNLFFIFFLVMMSFSSQMQNPMINNWGHLGGLLVGFFFMFVIMKPFRENDGVCCNYKIWFYLSAGLLSVFSVTGFVLFYTLDHYKGF